MTDKQWILLLLLLVVIFKLYRGQEAEARYKSWKPPPPPPPKWKYLHSGFKKQSPGLGHNNLTYEQLWTQAGYDYETARQWIDLGVKPNELDLVNWIKKTKGLKLTDLDKNKVWNLRHELVWSRRSKAPGIIYLD